MKRITMRYLLAAALCLLLMGCGEKSVEQRSEPAAPPEAQEPAVPDSPPEAGAPAASDEQPAAPAEPKGEEPVLPEADGVESQYTGTWRDGARGTSGGRCFMEIACADGVYTIDIWWGSSAAETSHWQYTGTYDDIWEGIDYIGTRYREVTQADGTVQQTAELEEATGLIYLDEDGNLLWEDTFEHTGDGMVFSREEE